MSKNTEGLFVVPHSGGKGTLRLVDTAVKVTERGTDLICRSTDSRERPCNKLLARVEYIHGRWFVVSRMWSGWVAASRCSNRHCSAPHSVVDLAILETARQICDGKDSWETAVGAFERVLAMTLCCAFPVFGQVGRIFPTVDTVSCAKEMFQGHITGAQLQQDTNLSKNRLLIPIPAGISVASLSGYVQAALGGRKEFPTSHADRKLWWPDVLRMLREALGDDYVQSNPVTQAKLVLLTPINVQTEEFIRRQVRRGEEDRIPRANLSTVEALTLLWVIFNSPDYYADKNQQIGILTNDGTCITHDLGLGSISLAPKLTIQKANEVNILRLLNTHPVNEITVCRRIDSQPPSEPPATHSQPLSSEDVAQAASN